MKVIEFNNQKFLLDYLKNCEWGAAKYLSQLILENKLLEYLGEDTKIFFLLNKSTVLAFCTFSNKDCINNEVLTPWIGFVYTDINNRGKKYSKLVIEEAIKLAKEKNYKRIYLATNHIGLYEKYGFIYLKNEIDIYEEDSRIYYFDIK